jgi:Holliday junction resolvase RusA-like endonuclease
MDAITFTVPGQPVPQPRHKISTWGGRGRAYIEARHPIHAYKQAIILAAGLAGRNGREGGGVSLEINFVFARPPSHWTKSGIAKGAPAIPPRCDWDNLGKAVSDAITDSAAIWIDDDQVVEAVVRKRYADRHELPGTTVTVRSV